MKHFFLQLMMSMLLISASIDIHAFQVDGIHYSLVSKDNHTIEVTDAPSGYTGEIRIPSIVSFDNQTWIVVGVGESAFYNCSRLTGIKLPNSVTYIGAKAFFSCDLLTNVDIPNSVTTIGSNAFDYCRSLTNLTLGNSVTDIGYRAFGSCSSLTGVTIPNSVINISGRAFENCSALTSITIPNSVIVIGDYAFSGCTALTSVTLGNSVTTLGWHVFEYCRSLTNVTLGNSITSIPYGTFLGCSSITNVTIPNSVTQIDFGAFDDCTSLEKITISSSNTTISCNFPDGLKEIYCMSTFAPQVKPVISWGTTHGKFTRDQLDNVIIYAPQGYLSNYLEKEPWSEFRNIFGIDYVPLKTIALDQHEITIDYRDTKRILLTFNPENSTDKTTVWSSSNSNVARVNSAGFVYGVEPGTAIITAKCGNLTAECAVTVREKNTPVESISLNKGEAKIGKSEVLQLTAIVKPDNATHKTVTWNSSEEAVATVSETGLVIPKAVGTTIITAKCCDLSVGCVVTVVEQTVTAKSISLNKSEAKVDIRETLQLTATVKPDEATDKTVAWSSSDEVVVTVSETGLVTAKAVGTATITAKCGELTATCAITVEDSSAIDEVFTDPDERVDVYSILGTRVRMGVRRDDITGLPAGVYILRTTSGKTMKVVIN